VVFLQVLTLPILFWNGPAGTSPLLEQAGITKIAVPPANAAAWKKTVHLAVEARDLKDAVKLQMPGIFFQADQASASRVPWIVSNGSRLIRNPNGMFYYDAPGKAAALAAAEASAYGNPASIQTDESGLQPIAEMLRFLASIPSAEGPALADIGFVDDGSPGAAEVMNLMVRDNLLFKIVGGREPDLKLTVQIGSEQYPKKELKDPNILVHKIRGDLTDDGRTIRIYGTSIVVARLTGKPGRIRLHLLNYGAATGTRVGGFRVRMLGQYSKYEVHSFNSPGKQLVDYEVESDATEFTVPELKAYAVIDFLR